MERRGQRHCRPSLSSATRFKDLSQCAVDRAGDCLQRCVGDGTSDAGAPDLGAVDICEDVGRSLGIVTCGASVLDVFLNLDVDAELLQGVGVSGQRAVAHTLDGLLLALVDDVSLDLGGVRLVLRGIDSQGNLLERNLAVQVLTCEDVPNRLGVDLAALGVGDCLHDGGELDRMERGRFMPWSVFMM